MPPVKSAEADTGTIVIGTDRTVSGSVTSTLQARNQSKTLVHEVLPVRDDGIKQLPYDAKHDRVLETRVRSLGEIADLAPGKSGKLTLTLQSGTYLLFCSQPGHYHDGMVAKLIVAP